MSEKEEMNKDEVIEALNMRYVYAKNAAALLQGENIDLKTQIELQQTRITKLVAEIDELRKPAA